MKDCGRSNRISGDRPDTNSSPSCPSLDSQFPILSFFFTKVETKKHNRIFSVARGFTLIEALVLLFIFGLVTVVFYQAFSAGTRFIIEAKNRMGAVALANEKMETVRNLDYSAVGTRRWNGSAYEYGTPSGEILEDETVAVNTRAYAVHTTAEYLDDPFDGEEPADTVPEDYKRVEIRVSWGSGGSDQTVSLTAFFTPPGVETDEGGGTLSISVLDNAGGGVDGATVNIANNTLNPAVSDSDTTDASGAALFSGARPSGQGYAVSISKAGYYAVSTYPPYPTSSFYPVDVHASVVAGAFNQKTVLMDRVSQLALSTKDPFGQDLPDIGFHIEGGRKIGDTADTLLPVYDFSQDTDSGDTAEKSFPDRSSGNYTLSLADTSRYLLLRLSTNESAVDGFSLLPGVSADVVMTVADKEVPAVLVTVADQASGVPVEGASVHLTNGTLPYDETVQTDRYGQAYFPTASPGLTAGDYDVSVTAAGFSDYDGSVTVGSGLATKSVELNP
jgi:type II secretory pathway pseudopilin PulG